MKLIGKFVFTFIVSALSLAQAHETVDHDTLTFRSDYRCPYVCDPTSTRPGYMVEVVRQIFEKQNIKVAVSLTNWVRATKETHSLKSQALLATTHSKTADLVFHSKPLGATRAAFFTRKDSSWSFKGRNSLQNMRIGIINGYSYGPSIDNMIATRHKSFIPFSGDRPLEQILKMIQSGRLDAFVVNPMSLHAALEDLKIPAESLKAAGWINTDDPFLFVGFSCRDPHASQYALILDRGIEEMRRSGELRRILEKYNLEDWEKSKISLGSLNDFRPGLLKSPLDLLNMFNTGSL